MLYNCASYEPLDKQEKERQKSAAMSYFKRPGAEL